MRLVGFAVLPTDQRKIWLFENSNGLVEMWKSCKEKGRKCVSGCKCIVFTNIMYL